MALIVAGGLAPTVSGKVGNAVFANNRGGRYVRTYVKPTNPQTALQATVRAFFGQISAAWKDAGADVQGQFNAFATANPQPSRTGLTQVPPALAMFQKVNMPRLMAGFPILTSSPNSPLTRSWAAGDLGIDYDAGTAAIVATFDTGDAWVTTNDSALLIFISPPQSLSKNFYKGKYNMIGAVYGNNSTPPTSPSTLTLGSPIPAGTRTFWRSYLTIGGGSEPAGNLGTQVTGYFDR